MCGKRVSHQTERQQMKNLCPMCIALCTVVFSLIGCGATNSPQIQCSVPESTITSNNHVILVGHGIPANDYPKDRLGKYFRMESGHHADNTDNSHTHNGQHKDHPGNVHLPPLSTWEQLDHDMRHWPRTPENDPYKFSVENIASRLEYKSGHHVLVAFNEFCAPTVEETIENAIAQGAQRIMILSIMLTPGGGHSEYDIPDSIKAAQRKYPGIEIVYAWPYDVDLIAQTLTTQIKLYDSN